jgi:hypothetical protein
MKSVDHTEECVLTVHTDIYIMGVKEDAGSEKQLLYASVFCHDGEYLSGIDVCEEITVPVASVERAAE